MTRTNRTVRVGVVGCGVVASAYYLPCLMAMDSVELAAVCDRVAVRAENCARLFGARFAFLDYDEMLAEMVGAVESVAKGERYSMTTTLMY